MSGTIFWCAVLVTAASYFGYPLLLYILCVVQRRPVRKRNITPFVSLLIPAYNESTVIRRKVENSLMLDYPPDRLEIVIASDGSSDTTTTIAEALADGDRVRVFSYPDNRGKCAVLNAAVKCLRGEIIVFSDATTLLEPDSVRHLIENFADPTVGAASGRYRVMKPNGTEIGAMEELYWKYEGFLKRCESQLASIVGSHGHLHGIRKALYPFPATGTINDDFVIPLSVIAKGYRTIYEPAAVGYEEAREMAGFRRRVRIMAGNFQQLREIQTLLRPCRPLPLFFFLFHKVSRLVVPLALFTMFVANVFLASEPLYFAALLAQIAFYFTAALGAVIAFRSRALMLPFYFSMINVAAFVGCYHALTNRRSMAWK